MKEFIYLYIFFKAYTVNGPNKSSLIFHHGKNYTNSSYTITCSTQPLVVWMVNGQPLPYSSNISFTAHNNYHESCNMNVSSVYKESIEIAAYPSTSLNLSLALVIYCDKDGSLDESCTSSVCFSQSTVLIFGM